MSMLCLDGDLASIQIVGGAMLNWRHTCSAETAVAVDQEGSHGSCPWTKNPRFARGSATRVNCCYGIFSHLSARFDGRTPLRLSTTHLSIIGFLIGSLFWQNWDMQAMEKKICYLSARPQNLSGKSPKSEQNGVKDLCSQKREMAWVFVLTKSWTGRSFFSVSRVKQFLIAG